VTSRAARGFTFIELIVSMAIMLAVMSSMFGIVDSARTVFEIDLERSDMQQRARVSLDALFRDVVMAGAGAQLPALAPFRRGEMNADLPGSAFGDRLSVRYLPPDAAPVDVVTITYALRIDPAGIPQLTRYDGRVSDLPVVDHVADLRFEYFGAAGETIPLERFIDGPWIPNAVAADRFDADLQAIRRVRATVRLRPARSFAGVALADLQVSLDVSPRNLNLP
jgi:prepilin-type N-terminal cleavage/methylation domain-containing protein